MLYWLIPLCVLGGAILITLGISLFCFFRIFYSPRRKKREEFPTPKGEIYDPFRPQMIQWIKEIRSIPHTDVSITSHDGLTLRGKYYEHEKGAPVEIMFHGYKGCAEADLCGGVYRCFALGHNALIVDHRASGESDGHVITFGAKESRDAWLWVDFVLQSINKDARIILTGISMGAATAMLAAGRPLPPNVVGVLADCGYTSTRAIIKKVMREMGLPADLFYPFVRLGAILFGHFDPDADSPVEAMRRCKLPVIFFHGDTDAFVPCEMSRENYEACAAEHKQLVLTPGAGHGLCFPIDMPTYLAQVRAFFEE